jgi:hypothetical protein
MHSFKDKKGMLWVACSECERGGNGSDEEKCSAGGSVKKYNGMGCFNGTLMQKYKDKISWGGVYRLCINKETYFFYEWLIISRNITSEKFEALSNGDIVNLKKEYQEFCNNSK